jgi:hypothetical protein
MMPTLFFISGYLAPASLQTRRRWSFLKARFKRLIVPWLIAVLTLIPLYKIIFLYSRNLPPQPWTTYLHFTNGIWSQNWLWFLPVLFAFNLLYLLFSKTRLSLPRMSLKAAILAAFVIGFLYSIAIDLLGLQGWTQTILFDFQNERLLLYFILFLLGAHCFRLDIFDGKPKHAILYHTVNSIAWLPITGYIFFLLYPWFKPGRSLVSPILDKLILWLCFMLSLLCLLYATIETFRRYQSKTGRLRNQLNRNAYYVYIIHVIVMGPIALIMLNTSMSSLSKYLVLTLSTFVTSNLIVYTFRKLTALCPVRLTR